MTTLQTVTYTNVTPGYSVEPSEHLETQLFQLYVEAIGMLHDFMPVGG